MSRILVLGASGMLGHKIMLKFMGKHDIMGTLRKANEHLNAVLGDNKSCLQTGIDVFDPDSLKSLIKSFKPDVVINCIGIVKQLKEANDPYISISVNALFPHLLERFANEFGFKLIHLSTDCVFSGKQGPYSEEDLSDVSDLYGQTKYLGEVKGVNALTLRTSIVGREINPPYTGLFEWFLAQDGKGKINGFTGALYTGLTTNAMADLIDKILTKPANLNGLYHVSSDAISKFDLLEIVKAQTGVNVEILRDETFKYDRRLDSAKFRSAIGWKPMNWPQMIQSMFEEDKAFYSHIKKTA